MTGIYVAIWTAFSTSHDAQIIITITRPLGDYLILDNFPKTFSANERWYTSFYYDFDLRGAYNITVTVIDELGKYHNKTGTIFSGDYVGILTMPGTGYYAFPGDIIECTGQFYNYYTSDISVDIVVTMEIYNSVTHTIENQTIHTESLTLTPVPFLYEPSHELTVDFLTAGSGRYTFFFEVTDINGRKTSILERIDVGAYFDIKYEFEQYMVFLGEYASFNIHITPFLFVDTEVNINITVQTPSSGVISLLELSNQLFSPSGPLSETWNDSFSYQALEVGYHDILIDVINASNPNNFWSHGFGFYAEESDPTLLITQTNKYPDLGDSEVIDFFIQSHFSFDIVVDISIVMTIQSGDDKVLYEEASTEILAVGSWETSITYTFDEYGLYNLEMLVVNGTGTEWSVRSSYRVREPDSSDTDKVSPSFKVILAIAILVTITILSRKRRD
ncbi:MAG: hypothetical protein ACFE9L_05500 [Candidatus Hodarchaeota archaeon]